MTASPRQEQLSSVTRLNRRKLTRAAAALRVLPLREHASAAAPFRWGGPASSLRHVGTHISITDRPIAARSVRMLDNAGNAARPKSSNGTRGIMSA